MKSKFLAVGPNPGKDLVVNEGGVFWARYPIKSPLITEKTDLIAVLKKKAKPLLKKGDILAISEKVVAIWQKRSWPLGEIKPSFWARFLSRFVTKSDKGIGISIPETFELAIRVAGLWRIILASIFSALTKPLGIKGVFYRIAGRQVAMIDGPVDYALPPYNRYVSLGPKNPNASAEFISQKLGFPLVAIVDANDYGIEVVGMSKNLLVNRRVMVRLLKGLLKDNPMGQTDEQTPFLILRKISRYKKETLNLVFLGDPGAGKGTQAEILKQKYGFNHLSPGDLFRREMKKGSKVGQIIARRYKRGEPQPNDIVNRLVFKKVKEIFKKNKPKGIIFDMYPFNRVQAQALGGIEKEFHLSYPLIFWFNVDSKEVVRRLSKRLVCSSCQKVFMADKLSQGLKTKRCPICKGRLVRREDDSAEIIRKRIAWYQDIKKELRSFYSVYPFWFEIDANPSVKKVAQQIEQKLKPLLNV